MVVDTSALVARLSSESDAERFARALSAAQVPLLSAVTRVALSCVIEVRKGEARRADVELLLRGGAPHPLPLPASGEREGPAKREGWNWAVA
jgi:uncharacterized protein with PIN domain